MYMLYINFTDGCTGYYEGVCNYNEWKREYDSISYTQKPSEAKEFPTYNSALSHARWLRDNYKCVGYIEVV